jgi:hypothetical protein
MAGDAVKFTSYLQEIKSGAVRGPVERALAQWDGKITKEAVERVNEVRMHDINVSRTSGEHRFRGSLLGSCHRMQMLSFLGKQGKPPSRGSEEIMRDGTYRHYYWQEIGLSAGFLTEVEWWESKEDWSFGGSLDGVMAKDSILEGKGGFELKTMNSKTFNKALAEGVSEKHLKQIGGYCEAGGYDWFSVVYEVRSFAVERKEFVVHYDDYLKNLVHENFETLLRHRDAKELPPIKPNYPKDNECASWCSFTDICKTASY